MYDFAGLALLSYQDTVAYLSSRDEEELPVGVRRLHPVDALVHGVLSQREGERAQFQVRSHTTHAYTWYVECGVGGCCFLVAVIHSIIDVCIRCMSVVSVNFTDSAIS